MKKSRQRGQLLIELLMAMGLAALLLPALFSAVLSSRMGRPQVEQQTQAIAFMKETEEAVKSIENTGWSTLPAGSTTSYHPVAPVLPVTTWSLATGTETVNRLTRSIVISDVYRDSSGSIVSSSSGTLDPSTKKAVITVSWTLPHASSISSTLYLTRFVNAAHQDTTRTDLLTGSRSGTSVATSSGSTTPNDGQIQLSAGGGGIGGDWCAPSNSIAAVYDLTNQGVPKSISATASASTDVAFTSTGGNASGHAIDGLSITHADPPVVSNPTQNNEGKAYGIYVNAGGSYVYVNENHFTVRILDAATLTAVGEYDNGGQGTSVFVSGTKGYTTVGNTLYVFDAGPPFKGVSTSQTQLGSKSITTGTMQKVIVVGTNAYVVTTDTTAQLQIFNISNPASIPAPTKINLGNGQAGVDVYVNGTQSYAYIVTKYVSGKSDFFIYNLTNSQITGQYATKNGLQPTAITVVPGNKAIVVGSSATNGDLYQVFDTTDPAGAYYCNTNTVNLSGVSNIYAISSVVQSTGYAYSYILTDNSSAEVQVIAGGGGQYASSGTYESATFDASTSAAFNSFTASVAQPVSTTLKMQVAVASPVSGSCSSVSGSSFTYVGPNGSTSEYFTPSGSTINGLIPLMSISPNYANPGRCFRYKTWFDTSEQTSSPVLYDVNINYSP